MAKPREFDADSVLDAIMRCCGSRGYEATSMRELIEQTGIAGASLYTAFGDKRAMYRTALECYVGSSTTDRIRRCKALRPYQAIATFYDEIIDRSLGDRDHKGCMLVNACPGHRPRLRAGRPQYADPIARAWMAGTRPAMTGTRSPGAQPALPDPAACRHVVTLPSAPPPARDR